jgi:hypothetical protein
LIRLIRQIEAALAPHRQQRPRFVALGHNRPSSVNPPLDRDLQHARHNNVNVVTSDSSKIPEIGRVLGYAARRTAGSPSTT